MRSKNTGNKITSDFLEDRLKQALNNRFLAETKFRANHVYQWTVLFCDVSRNLKNVLDIDENQINDLTAEYREVVNGILSTFDPPFVGSGDGPQVIACFEKPEQAADAAIEIQDELKEWSSRCDGGQYYRPSIGLHSGDFVVVNDELKQSNACNLGKRIETQAKSGDLYISLSTYEKLKEFSNYKLVFVEEAILKNIPESQKIYSILWKQSSPLTVFDGTVRSVSETAEVQEETEEEANKPATEMAMGILICDVAGSTRKFWNLGDREGNILIEIFKKEVFMILKKYKAAHIENREGDMIVACFTMEKPILNVLAAVEIQKNFFTRNINLGARTREKLETSIGIHVGNIKIRHGEIIPTPAFFFCKGAQDLAEASEICLTDEVAKLIKEYTHLSMTEIGETMIKGIPDPVKIYSLEWYKKGSENPLRRESIIKPSPGFPLKR